MILLLGACASPPESPPESEGQPIVVASPLPAPVEAPSALARVVVGLALGEQTTCRVHDDGLVACRGALGEEPLVLPGAVEVDDTRLCGRADGQVRCVRGGLLEQHPTPFVELARGGGVPCGRDPSGQVFCLSGRDRDEADADLRAVPLPGPAVRVVADGERAHALLSDGRLFGWDPFEAMIREPAPTLEDEGVLGVDGSWMTTCWWTASAVRCTDRHTKALASVAAVAVGRAHACALAGGEVTCWGDRTFGQTTVPELGAVVALAAGDDHTCALGPSGLVRCWGRDDRGQLTAE